MRNQFNSFEERNKKKVRRKFKKNCTKKKFLLLVVLSVSELVHNIDY